MDKLELIQKFVSNIEGIEFSSVEDKMYPYVIIEQASSRTIQKLIEYANGTDFSVSVIYQKLQVFTLSCFTAYEIEMHNKSKIYGNEKK